MFIGFDVPFIGLVCSPMHGLDALQSNSGTCADQDEPELVARPPTTAETTRM